MCVNNGRRLLCITFFFGGLASSRPEVEASNCLSLPSAMSHFLKLNASPPLSNVSSGLWMGFQT